MVGQLLAFLPVTYFIVLGIIVGGFMVLMMVFAVFGDPREAVARLSIGLAILLVLTATVGIALYIVNQQVQSGMIAEETVDLWSEVGLWFIAGWGALGAALYVVLSVSSLDPTLIVHRIARRQYLEARQSSLREQVKRPSALGYQIPARYEDLAGSRVLLTGGANTGLRAFVKQLALEICDTALKGTKTPLPIVIDLDVRLQQARPLPIDAESLITELKVDTFMAAQTLLRAAEDGDLWIILDGSHRLLKPNLLQFSDQLRLGPFAYAFRNQRILLALSAPLDPNLSFWLLDARFVPAKLDEWLAGGPDRTRS